LIQWPEQAVTAAYIHIPFCISKCAYCDFLSFSACAPERRQAYVQALLNEIEQTASLTHDSLSAKSRLETVYVGGGTPTVLSEDQCVSIMQKIQTEFALTEDAECTIEANPGTVTHEKLVRCRSAGFNRISFGVQAVQPHLLHMMGRIHTAEQAQESIEDASRAGFRNISADILFGLPGQTLQDVRDTLQRVLSWPVTHVSYYGLILEEGTPLADQCYKGFLTLPDDQTEREHYHLIRDVLEANGFQQYEISSSARDGFSCRHNLTYWRGLPYHGFGCGAHRFVNGWRGSNTNDLDEYINNFSNRYTLPDRPVHRHYGQKLNIPAAHWHESIDYEEAMREMMLLGFRLTKGISARVFKARFGCGYQEVFADSLDLLLRQHLIAIEGDLIRLSRKGLDFANDVFRQFV